MKKYYIDGKEVSALDKVKHKLKQLNEASELLEEFSDRCAWADDFAHYESIREALDSVYTAVEHSKDEIDEMIQEIENQIEEMEAKKKSTEVELDQEFAHNIEYYLD
jgi:chromosome segregation ATPase